MENTLKKDLEAGKKVEVDIKIVYNKASSSKRPEKFIFKSVVTDSKGNIEIIKKSFYN